MTTEKKPKAKPAPAKPAPAPAPAVAQPAPAPAPVVRHTVAPVPVPRPPVPEDVEAGLRFLHMTTVQTKAQLSELTATVNALTELLVAQGALAMDQFQRRRHLTVLRENERIEAEDAQVQLTDVENKYAMEELPEIDCEARLHLCRARCCSFHFSLSIQDLDERIVRWDYGKPYMIARREDGYCVHNVEGTCLCNVYVNRPAVCRGYDCRTDKRVWIDFARRIPAP